MPFIGELISLGTAVCWTFTVVGFESAGKRVGSLSVNIIRLLFGFVLLSITLGITTGSYIPLYMSDSSWFWLSMSGLVGLVIGDLFLFQAFVDVGGRISLLIYSSVPVISAIFGFLLFGEILGLYDIIGMVVVLTAISMVIMMRQNDEEAHEHTKRGILFAILGAFGQAVGLILSKQGMGDYSAFAATQVRIIAAIIGFVIYITAKRQWKNIFIAFKDKTALMFIGLGSIFGPFLGVSSSLLALQYTSLGVSTTIAQLNVIMIIPFSILLFKEKVYWQEIVAAIVAIGGAVLLFL